MVQQTGSFSPSNYSNNFLWTTSLQEGDEDYSLILISKYLLVEILYCVR